MKKIIQDKRIHKEDRRSWSAIPRYPFIDSSNVTVFEDRRIMAERRGCELKEITLEDMKIEANLIE